MKNLPLWAFSAGAWIGVVDGTLALRLAPSIAGSPPERIGTILVSILVDAIFLAGLGIAAVLAGAALRRRSPGRPSVPWARFVGSVALAVLVGVAGALAGWSGENKPASLGRSNIILISLDTLRADHLGCYGYERNTSPYIDALAAQGILFENAFAPSHWTLPSHASMLTGLDPVTAGMLHARDVLDESFDTIAELLQRDGYRTAAFVGNGPFSYIGSEHGFDQGFREFHHTPYHPRWCGGRLARLLAKFHWKYVRHKTDTAQHQVRQVQNWLWRHRNEPFFLFLHLFDIHSDTHRLPYEAPRPFHDMFDPDYSGTFTGCNDGSCASEMLKRYADGKIKEPMSADDVNRMRALYDGGIAFTDSQLGRLFDYMQELGLEENTVVVITSDHGEAFFEHGMPLHEDLHNENLHVPLIARVPGGQAGRKIEAIVQVEDLVPTLLEVVGSESSSKFSGRSFASLILDGGLEAGEEREAFSFSGKFLSVRSSRWKYICNWNGSSGPEKGGLELLFDVRSDPGEQFPVEGANAADALAELKQLMEARLEASFANRKEAGLTPSAQVLPSQDDIEELRALGYTE